MRQPFPNDYWFCDLDCADPEYQSHCGPCGRELQWRSLRNELAGALLAVEGLIDTDPEAFVRLPLEVRTAVRVALRKAGVR